MQVLQKEEKLKQTLIDYYFFIQREAEKYWNRDNYCALKIQTFYRKYLERNKFLALKKATLAIQRYFRGIFARIKFKLLLQNEINNKNVIYFRNQATKIKKLYLFYQLTNKYLFNSFKGYYNRKYIHDFYARKEYLNFIKGKNEIFREDLKKTAEEEKIEEDKLKEAIARAEFQELAKNVHHLSSTFSIPGIFNPPYSQKKPSAFDIPIESHLKQTFKANYEWKAPNRKIINSFKQSLKQQQETQ